MTTELVIPAEVKHFVEEIIEKNGLSPSTKTEYAPGAEHGAGFTSKTLIVDVNDREKSLSLFLKVPLGLTLQKRLPMHKLFANEKYFYSTVAPAYASFLKEKGIEGGFRNVPKCYGIFGDSIALENLKPKGFRLFAKGQTMNDDHIILSLRTFAKFHAISYAFKDQRKELYNAFLRDIQFCMIDVVQGAGFDKMASIAWKEFLKGLDPVEDKDLLDAGENLEELLIDVLVNVEKYPNEYSTITQGDSWGNNIMYLYDQNNSDNVTDVMLVDWQLLRYGSPAIDLAYFFYPISSEATIEKYDYYLTIYHEELSKRIKQLGSNPETLYPFSVLMKEWKRFARFGFAMSIFIVRGLLMEKDEVPNLDLDPELYDKIINGEVDMKSVGPQMKSEALYRSRLKLIFSHFVKHGFLEGDLANDHV